KETQTPKTPFYMNRTFEILQCPPLYQRPRHALHIHAMPCLVALEHATAHSAHSTHAAHTAHTTGAGALLFGSIDDSALSSTEKRGNTRGVKKSSADNLERVKNT